MKNLSKKQKKCKKTFKTEPEGSPCGPVPEIIFFIHHNIENFGVYILFCKNSEGLRGAFYPAFPV